MLIEGFLWLELLDEVFFLWVLWGVLGGVEIIFGWFWIWGRELWVIMCRIGCCSVMKLN